MSFLVRSLLSIFVLTTMASPGLGQEEFDSCPTRPGQAFVEDACLDAIGEAMRSADTELAGRLLDNLAMNYRREGRVEDAISTLRRRIDLTQPELPHNATTQLAELLVESDRASEAASLLASLIEQSHGDLTGGETWLRGGAELQLARIYTEMGDWSLGERYYKQSIEDLSHGPGGAPQRDAVVGLIKLYEEQGRKKQALETCLRWKESLEIGPPPQDDPCAGLESASSEGRS